jgi:hypothetical protein
MLPTGGRKWQLIYPWYHHFDSSQYFVDAGILSETVSGHLNDTK